ncbi:MAG: tRNA dihydrouridine synthase DusB [Deferrisomatales bacterium]
MRLGALELRPPLFLAPMAGITHSAFRRLVGGYGGVGLFSTEMLSARSLPVEDPATSPFLVRTAEESPLSFQLLVASPEEIAPALDVVHRLGADAVDLNFGCPAPQARRRGGGSRLMEAPERARALVAEARRRTALPLTAKIRLGERLDEGALSAFCRMLEGEGVELLTVHARLRKEPYGRRARWEWVGKVKRWVSIPVVGNGGVFSAADARRCLEVSGCDGLMVGRGAAVRPWVFAEIAREVYGVPVPAARPTPAQAFRTVADLLDESLPPERRLGRLKELTHYLAQNYPFGHHLAAAVQSSPSVAVARERAEAFFADHEAPPA